MRFEEKHKIFLIECFACFKTAGETLRAFKEEFGVEITRDAARNYDPQRRQSGGLAKKWRILHGEIRAAYLTKIQDIAVANQAYRLTVLQDLLEKELSATKQNKAFTLSILEQAAKESGGHFTNRRELSGPGGKPIETVSFTLDQWKEQAASRTAQAESVMEIFESSNE